MSIDINNFNIREAQDQDFSTLAGLWESLDKMHTEMDPHYFCIAQDARQNIIKKTLKDSESKIWIALIDKTPAGFLMASTRERKGSSFQKVGYIDDLYIDPSFRIQGLATDLLNLAINWFKSLNLKLVETSVASKNAIANCFWQKRGLEPCLCRYKMNI